MENDTQVEDETLEVQEEEVEVEEIADDEPEESPEDLKARLKKAEELANNYKVRAEKAEAKAKGGEKTAKIDTSLSTKDVLALSKANIDDEDLDEVLEYASYKKMPIHEVLKSPILKATLAQKAEERKSAAAVNTGSTRRAGNTTSDERLLADARKGVLPDSPDDIARLARLKLQRK